ncbi:hypothetical protein C7S15_8200 [Burkholderia cepacia]|nr:hypothetical protein [Burkholderia cepacia]
MPGIPPALERSPPMNAMRFACRAGTTIDHRLNIRRRLFEYRNNQK